MTARRNVGPAVGVALVALALLVVGPKNLAAAFRPLLAHPGAALLGLLLHVLGVVAVHVRWAVLLRGAGLETPVLSVLRLGWIGQFAACTLPGGMASGDVVKSFYVATLHPNRRARAVTTVVFDRVLGLIVLSTIAFLGAVGAPGSTRLGATRPILATLLAGGLLLLALLFSKRIRMALGLTRLFARIPLRFLREAQDALALYAGSRGTVGRAALIALLSQSFTLAAFFFYAFALGEGLSPYALVVGIPVAQMVSAIPALPGGFGTGDLAFVALLPEAGVPAGTALALSLTYRAAHLLIALPAGFWFLKRRAPLPPEGALR